MQDGQKGKGGGSPLRAWVCAAGEGRPWGRGWAEMGPQAPKSCVGVQELGLAWETPGWEAGVTRVLWVLENALWLVTRAGDPNPRAGDQSWSVACWEPAARQVSGGVGSPAPPVPTAAPHRCQERRSSAPCQIHVTSECHSSATPVVNCACEGSRLRTVPPTPVVETWSSPTPVPGAIKRLGTATLGDSRAGHRGTRPISEQTVYQAIGGFGSGGRFQTGSRNYVACLPLRGGCSVPSLLGAGGLVTG